GAVAKTKAATAAGESRRTFVAVWVIRGLPSAAHRGCNRLHERDVGETFSHSVATLLSPRCHKRGRGRALKASKMSGAGPPPRGAPCPRRPSAARILRP